MPAQAFGYDGAGLVIFQRTGAPAARKAKTLPSATENEMSFSPARKK